MSTAFAMKYRILKNGPVALMIMGSIALVYCVTTIIRQHSYQGRAMHAFVNSTDAAATRSLPRREYAIGANNRKPDEGSVVGRIVIPRLRTDLVVVEGTEPRDLRVAPGHIPGTPLPGQRGNIAIAGHRDTFFRPLRKIRQHDVIDLVTAAGLDEYRVVSTEVVTPDDVQVLRPTGHDSLTIVTCYPFSWIGPAPYRFILHADRFAHRLSSIRRDEESDAFAGKAPQSRSDSNAIHRKQ